MDVFVCVILANLLPIKVWIKYVNLHGLFILVHAPWNSNDGMAMHDPQVDFLGLIWVNLFSCIFLLGILIWLHNSSLDNQLCMHNNIERL